MQDVYLAQGKASKYNCESQILLKMDFGANLLRILACPFYFLANNPSHKEQF
jgi:hypothetical protein